MKRLLICTVVSAALAFLTHAGPDNNLTVLCGALGFFGASYISGIKHFSYAAIAVGSVLGAIITPIYALRNAHGAIMFLAVFFISWTVLTISTIGHSLGEATLYKLQK